VPAECLADNRAQAVDDVEDALGEAGRLDEFGKEERRQRRVLGRLEDDRAASGEGRGNFLGCRGERASTKPGVSGELEDRGRNSAPAQRTQTIMSVG
jgi:hypothetical protein